jgi:hypothetical protein
MGSHPAPLEKAATKLLATYGVKAIWDIHLAAAAADGIGEPDLASSLVKLAEAAERCLMRRSSAPTLRPT